MYTKILAFLILATFVACSSTKKTPLQKRITSHLDVDLHDNHFVGFLVYDPVKRDTLYNYNGQKYFTPASNTKIFTLYTALKLLPDRIPALKYIAQDDTLYIQGTGDPSLLHPFFKDSTALRFLKTYDHVVLNQPLLQIENYGPGWAWEDYDRYYAAERSAFPIYGNVVALWQKDSLVVSPSYFRESVIPLNYKSNRELHKNIFYFDPLRKDTVAIPFMVDDTLVAKLLEDVAQKKIGLTSRKFTEKKQTLYGISSDTLYKRMMYESDNFLAEQLLLMAASTLSDTLDGSKAQRYMLSHFLPDLKHPPRWVDGSGLSRYNLFTPESMVHILSKMYVEIPRDRLLNFFPRAGKSGTLKNWGNGDSETQLYAKSGSLGNNYCLSGYLITKSGKTLIFSFMNNHYRVPSTEVRAWMQTILEGIGDSY